MEEEEMKDDAVNVSPVEVVKKVARSKIIIMMQWKNKIK
jgi:hypothetical protein